MSEMRRTTPRDVPGWPIAVVGLLAFLVGGSGCRKAVSFDVGEVPVPAPLVTAAKLDSGDPRAAFAAPSPEQADDPDFWLSVARAAELGLGEAFGAGGDGAGVSDATLHHLAVQRYALARWLKQSPDRLTRSDVGDRSSRFRVWIEPPDAPAGVLDPARFDRLIPAAAVRLRGMQHRFRREGFGLPLVGVMETTEATLRVTPNLPPEGLFLPVTLTVDFEDLSDGTTEARLALLDPDRVRAVHKFGVPFQLSVDTTAPIAMLFAETQLQHEANVGLWDPTRTESRTGIYLHEPFVADKTPVLFIHGLWSSPLTWRDMLNTLRADPVLARHYQFWMFLYPTGMPVPRSSAFLRGHLAALRAHYESDPEAAAGVAAEDLVVVGHSMGGLLTKTLVQGGGETIWHAFHPEPFETIDAPPGVRERLTEAFFYEPDARASRAVFIATPHGGSTLADSWFSVLGRSQIEPPAILADVDAWIDEERRRLRGRGYDRDRYRVLRGLPTSIDNLSPRCSYLDAYNRIPIPDRVPYHSIIAEQRDLSNPTSDGVVPFESARLDGAASELVVRSGHGAVANPQAIEEVRRILHEHLAQRRAAETATQQTAP
ncbi:MAG: alpha/beta hydrolase [Planctomycetota bacterium]